ncbi:MAG: hypothetical protein HQK59_05935 [Deltaproteobacteria bacterium]|nr:hypothetical protein [Deltaproteobacteria bacterium]MBF0526563.1 hypothetical protein [Deltaproteobacteria bacterium]
MGARVLFVVLSGDLTIIESSHLHILPTIYMTIHMTSHIHIRLSSYRYIHRR